MHAFQLCLKPQNVLSRRVTIATHKSQYRSFSMVQGVDLYVFGVPGHPQCTDLGTPNGTLTPPKTLYKSKERPIVRATLYLVSNRVDVLPAPTDLYRSQFRAQQGPSSSKWTLVALAGSRPQERTIHAQQGPYSMEGPLVPEVGP